jgi:hypothetical protein
MAREAGFQTGIAGIGVPLNRISVNDGTDAPWMLEAMGKFAALVAAAEREECAKVCDLIAINACDDRAHECGVAIRARGQE